MDSIKVITRKTVKVLVREFKISELDITKFSKGFLEHNLPSDTIVYVRCDGAGNLELRGNKGEYATIVPDKGTPIEQTDDFKINGSGLFHWNSSANKITKLRIVEWFNNLSDVEKGYVDQLRYEAASDEYDSHCGAEI